MVRKVRYDEVRRVKERRGGLSVLVGKESRRTAPGQELFVLSVPWGGGSNERANAICETLGTISVDKKREGTTTECQEG